jgi:hypothetical protein
MKKIILLLTTLLGFSCATITYNHDETFDFSRYPKALIVLDCSSLGLYSYKKELVDHFRDQLNKTATFVKIYDFISDSAIVDSLPDSCVMISVKIASSNMPSEEEDCVTQSGDNWESTSCSGNFSLNLTVYCQATDSKNSLLKDLHEDGSYNGSSSETLTDVTKGAFKDALDKVATDFSKKFSI